MKLGTETDRYLPVERDPLFLSSHWNKPEWLCDKCGCYSSDEEVCSECGKVIGAKDSTP